MTDFDTALATFITGCQETVDRYHEHMGYGDINAVEITLDPNGRRYKRIVRSDVNGSSRSVHCFVDTTNGDVLKAAGWKSPAKHARGNIFDDHNGLSRMGPYGPEYLR